MYSVLIQGEVDNQTTSDRTTIPWLKKKRDEKNNRNSTKLGKDGKPRNKKKETEERLTRQRIDTRATSLGLHPPMSGPPIALCLLSPAASSPLEGEGGSPCKRLKDCLFRIKKREMRLHLPRSRTLFFIFHLSCGSGCRIAPPLLRRRAIDLSGVIDACLDGPFGMACARMVGMVTRWTVWCGGCCCLCHGQWSEMREDVDGHEVQWARRGNQERSGVYVEVVVPLKPAWPVGQVLESSPLHGMGQMD